MYKCKENYKKNETVIHFVTLNGSNPVLNLDQIIKWFKCYSENNKIIKFFNINSSKEK